MIRTVLGAAALAVTLAACGTNSTDRTTGGAAAGAATGAGIGALGGPVGALAGAAIGGGAGAITGATTSPNEVNLGKPVWSNPEVRTPVGDGKAASSTHRSRHQTAQARRDAQRESDRAYMGGGMVGTGTGATTTTGTGTTGTGPATTGAASTTPSGTSAPAAPVQ
ncbi:hypothetical protein [Paracraurococcus lichenis]|uniref:YMGG-like Gly-zipper domain-containing protein n=1 Tax=Paracraurococcus lichenis TaxID=3064888 RepID=A0ABT9E086_9PROT|nr:hypothetical protein [Paracraurococcus sp. LOR1-02]MDO9709582.1 hypothetical protein [Paracraurococcus sp. LOR1-02]